jgi:hypothetical protein
MGVGRFLVCLLTFFDVLGLVGFEAEEVEGLIQRLALAGEFRGHVFAYIESLPHAPDDPQGLTLKRRRFNKL